ncbi:hypothetical protein [Aurantiacibacter gilvus]|uniref:Uncharacterized protein n=1 Tax=Aurantiacibacter gilvus TaxID=3139141 RepID=A0ABU9IBL1_9SPHN
MFDMILSIIMFAAIVLLIGAVALFRKGMTKQATLMVILAVVMAVNVAIWLVPDENGTSPAELVSEAGQ